MKLPVHIIYTVIIILIVASFLTGYYVSEYYSGKLLSIKESELNELRSKNEELKSRIEELEARILQLETIKFDLNAQVELLEKELSNMISKLQDKDREISRLSYSCGACSRDISDLKNRLLSIRTIIERLKNDKELLVVLRTEPPLNRTEAKIYWNDTRSGLYKINPNLVSTIDTILQYLDYYFNWYESAPTDGTPDRICNWIFSFTPEAERYGSAISKLREEIYIVIISDIGEALRILEEST